MLDLVLAMVLAVAVVWGMNHMRPATIAYGALAIGWVVAVTLLVQWVMGR
jgi:hypothetical protein